MIQVLPISSRKCGCRLAAAIVLMLAMAAISATAQQSAAASSAEQGQSSSQQTPQQQNADQQKSDQPGFGGQLAKEEREAEGEENAGLKKSASVRWLAKLTGGDVERAYWMSLVLNFLVVFAIVLWAGRKFLPRIFRDRTHAIQQAIQEARKASEEANHRLAEVELRLSKMGEEISAMKAEGEKDITAEEARIKAAAEEDGRKIVESAEQEIAAAAKAARRDLTAYAADLAVSLAQRQIHVDPGTDEALVRNFADHLTKTGGGSKN